MCACVCIYTSEETIQSLMWLVKKGGRIFALMNEISHGIAEIGRKVKATEFKLLIPCRIFLS